MCRRTVRRIAGVGLGTLILNFAIAVQAEDRPQPTIPNILVEISRDLANAAAASQPIDQTGPINERKGRMQISGNQHTRAVVGVDFVPNNNGAIVDLLLNGGTHADTAATAGPVTAYVTTRVTYNARMRICIDENGVHCLSGASSCTQLDENTLNCLQTKFRGPMDPMVRKIAYKVYTKKKPKIDSDVLREAGKTVNKQFDEHAGEELGKANEKYQQEIREPLMKRGVFPQRIHILSSADQIGFRALLNDPTGKSRTFAKVPEIAGNPDIAVRVEESLLNNATHAMFAGKKFTGEELEKEFTTLLKPIMGEVKMMDAGEKPFSITFPKEKPIEIHFDKQMVRVTLRGSEFTAGDNEYDGMDTTAIYKLSQKGKGLLAERQGDLIIFPPGFVQGKDKLGAREQVLRKLLERKFGRVLKPVFDMQTIDVPEKLKQIGELVTTQVDVTNGWFVIGLRRIPGPPAAPGPAAPAKVAAGN